MMTWYITINGTQIAWFVKVKRLILIVQNAIEHNKQQDRTFLVTISLTFDNTAIVYSQMIPDFISTNRYISYTVLFCLTYLDVTPTGCFCLCITVTGRHFVSIWNTQTTAKHWVNGEREAKWTASDIWCGACTKYK